MSGNIAVPQHTPSCSASRAARELALKRSEFDLAVHLGRIRTVPDEGGGGRRVPREEIDRLLGSVEELREDVRVVGTGEAAVLMHVPASRFTRLARLGLVVPVRFYLNRYRAVVWLYLADELEQFAADENNAPLLTGRMPERMRAQVAAGLDLRARNWRGRHLGFLLRQADGPWQRAGALAGFLDPLQIAELVEDPYERSHVNRFRPGPPTHGTPGSPATHLAEKLMTADDPDEIGWLRSDLVRTLEEARAHEPAPRPTNTPPTPQVSRTLLLPSAPDVQPTQAPPPALEPETPQRPRRSPRGLLSRLCRRSS
ncbi:DUF6397 family protein [Streptomyces sp. NPDC096132]|uniref:DUF6397 family protein n=1 Tax=Streptomyces sp. NPDC096132 TaxID=3366075 RepID=UPI0037FAC847